MSERIFTAHLPEGREPVDLVLVDDRWRWGAFIFPLIWALWSRSWFLAIAIALFTGLAAAAGSLGGPASALALAFGLRFLLGFEGGEAARLDRTLRGWRTLGAISAPDWRSAEGLWFADAARVAPADPGPAGPWSASGRARPEFVA